MVAAVQEYQDLKNCYDFWDLIALKLEIFSAMILTIISWV